MIVLRRESRLSPESSNQAALNLHQSVEGGFSSRASGRRPLRRRRSRHEDPPVDSDPEVAWDTELARRADEIQRGTAVGKPGDQVFAELRMRMDEEQIRLSSGFEFWKLIEVSRRQKTISREELERRLDQSP
jgi:hypothetical protein